MQSRDRTPALSWCLLVVFCVSSQWASADSTDGGLAVRRTQQQRLSPRTLARHLRTQAEATPLSVSILEAPSNNAQAVAKALALQAALDTDKDGVLHNLFVAWSQQFDKQYSDLEEAKQQLSSFAQSVDAMVRHNSAAHQGHWRGLAATATVYKLPKQLGSKTPVKTDTPLSNTPPGAINWVTLGYTTPVKDQGPFCVSTWVNVAMSCIDSAVAIQFNIKPIRFSRQWALDCANGETDSHLACSPVQKCSHGCDGGYIDDAIDLGMYRTLPVESNYSYTAMHSANTSKCLPKAISLTAADAERPLKPIFWIQNLGVKDPLNPTVRRGYLTFKNGPIELQRAIALQPVIVFWNTQNINTTDLANPYDPNFLSYQGGMFYGTTCVGGLSSNHAMLAVGFNAQAAVPYFILQNSWGTGWGEKGFIRVYMDTGKKYGVCGIHQSSSWAPAKFDAHIPMVSMPKRSPPPSPKPKPLPKAGRKLF